MNKRKNNLRSGFSIMEIIIVITIIGILAAATFGYLRYVQTAKESTTESKLGALDQAIETYNTKIGEYPNELSELVEGPQKAELAKRFGLSLASAADLKDGWGKAIVYEKLSSGNPPYELYANLPNGKKLYSRASQGR